MQRSEARLVINEEVCQYLDGLLSKKFISPRIHEAVKSKYLKEQEICAEDLSEIQKNLQQNEREFTKMLTHYALGIELKTYKRLLSLEEISENRFRILQNSIHRQLNRLDRDILPEERTATHKYAPDIPQNFWLSTWLKKIGAQSLGQTIMQAYKRSRIMARLQHYRARRIASWKVLRDFERLQGDHPIFSESEAIKKIIKRYRQWNLGAEKKMRSLDNKYPKLVTQTRVRMAERSCLEKEKRLEAEFLEKGFISEKIFADLDQAVGQRVRGCQKRSLWDYLFQH